MSLANDLALKICNNFARDLFAQANPAMCYQSLQLTEAPQAAVRNLTSFEPNELQLHTARRTICLIGVSKAVRAMKGQFCSPPIPLNDSAVLNVFCDVAMLDSLLYNHFCIIV